MTRTALWAVLAMSALLVVTGCTEAPSPVPDASTSGQAVIPETDPPDDSGVAESLEAVIVVAGVDVDGRDVTVSGYVAGILESGGSCSFAFNGPIDAAPAVTTGEADRSSTTCGGVQTPIESFTKGSWEVTLTYTALSGEVVDSTPVPLEIP